MKMRCNEFQAMVNPTQRAIIRMITTEANKKLDALENYIKKIQIAKWKTNKITPKTGRFSYQGF